MKNALSTRTADAIESQKAISAADWEIREIQMAAYAIHQHFKTIADQADIARDKIRQGNFEGAIAAFTQCQDNADYSEAWQATPEGIKELLHDIQQCKITLANQTPSTKNNGESA